MLTVSNSRAAGRKEARGDRFDKTVAVTSNLNVHQEKIYNAEKGNAVITEGVEGVQRVREPGEKRLSVREGQH